MVSAPAVPLPCSPACASGTSVRTIAIDMAARAAQLDPRSVRNPVLCVVLGWYLERRGAAAGDADCLQRMHCSRLHTATDSLVRSAAQGREHSDCSLWDHSPFNVLVCRGAPEGGTDRRDSAATRVACALSDCLGKSSPPLLPLPFAKDTVSSPLVPSSLSHTTQ